MSTLRKKAGIITGLGILATGFTPVDAEPMRNNPPNILVIFVDDLGCGDISFLGATDVKTPNIDKLFHSGITFRNFYANSCVCSPSRAALLTGRYPDMVGVPGVIRTKATNSWGYFHSNGPILPEVLQRVGYHTALIGKWHLGLESPNTPNECGFQYFHGFLGDMMDDYYTHLRHGFNYMRQNQEPITAEGHATDIFTDWAIQYLTSQVNNSQPFFMLLAYNAPHTPVQPPAEWLSKVKKRLPGIQELRAKYIASVEHLDNDIGRVLETLRKNNQEKNTLIIFTSDNGGQLSVGASNGNCRGGKQDFYEGGIHVPACMVWPRYIMAGRSSDNIALTMDIFPTLSQAAGLSIYHQVDGISLLPTLLGKPQDTGYRTIFWMRREGGTYGGNCYYAVRYREYKLVQNSPYDSTQLFNLNTDKQERLPLDKHSEVYQHLFNALSEHIHNSGSVAWQKPQ